MEDRAKWAHPSFIDAIARRLLPDNVIEPGAAGSEWAPPRLAWDADRAPGTTIQTLTGQWHDSVTGQRGDDIVSLIAMVKAVSNADAQAIAVQWIAEIELDADQRSAARKSKTQSEWVSLIEAVRIVLRLTTVDGEQLAERISFKGWNGYATADEQATFAEAQRTVLSILKAGKTRAEGEDTRKNVSRSIGAAEWKDLTIADLWASAVQHRRFPLDRIESVYVNATELSRAIRATTALPGKRRRGPKPIVKDRIVTKMRQEIKDGILTLEGLREIKSISLAKHHDASPNWCDLARKELLSELETLKNSEPK